MQLTSVTIFAELLNAFKDALSRALDLLYPWVFVMFALLTLIDLVLLIAKTMDKGRAYALVGWVVRLLFLSYLISRWDWLSRLIVDQGVEMGLYGAGGAIPRQEFLNPGAYYQHGLDLGQVLFDQWNNMTLSGLVETLMAPFITLIYLGAWLTFLLTFFLMACVVFLAQVELEFAVPALLVLLPFLMLKPTAWIGQGTLTYLVRMSYRFLMLALIAGIIMPVIKTVTVLPNADTRQAVMLALAAVIFLIVFLKGSKMATNIMSGAFTLGAGSAAEATLLLAHTVTTLKNVVGGLASGGIRGASEVLKQSAEGWRTPPSIPPAVLTAREQYQSMRRGWRDEG